MKVGKVAETVLKRSVFKQLQVKRKEVLIGPGVGEDCSVIQVDRDECIVLSTDPITGASENIGDLAVHITLNDLAASGAEPIGLMLTLLLPDGYSEGDLKALMQSINKQARSFNVQVIGGHTEVTKVVNQPLVTVTGVGKVKKDKVLTKDKIKAGMDIVMTKWAGLEGTSILAGEGRDLLESYYHSDLIEHGKALSQYLSVVEDSRIAMKYGAVAMHDVTEGGIMGALWELGEKAGLGLMVDQALIPVRQETVEVCEYFDLNPYKLIGSGSLLIITPQGHELVEALEAESIKATVIGQMTEGKHKQVKFNEIMRSVAPAKSDELYKGLERINK